MLPSKDSGAAMASSRGTDRSSSFLLLSRVTASWRSPKGCVYLAGLRRGDYEESGKGKGKVGPHPSRGQKEPTESSQERPACKKLLFFPNYEHFLTRGGGTQSSNLRLHQDHV